MKIIITTIIVLSFLALLNLSIEVLDFALDIFGGVLDLFFDVGGDIEFD